MKIKYLIIAAAAVVAIRFIVLYHRYKENEKAVKAATSADATGDEGTPAVEPANKLKVIKANFVSNTAQMDGVSVQPSIGKGNII